MPQPSLQRGITTAYNKANNDKADQVADRGIQEGYDKGLFELASFFAGQRKDILKVIVRIQKAILRVLKAESKERNDEEERKAREQKALYGKDAGKVTLQKSFPHQLPQHAEGACRVEIVKPKIDEVDAKTMLATYMMFSFIKNWAWVPTQEPSMGVLG